MGIIKLLFAPLRRVLSFPLIQLAIVIVVIVFLQAADSKSLLGELFGALDLLVDYSVKAMAGIFEVRSFTRSWLVTGFMIAYVYLGALLILFLLKLAFATVVEIVARNNAFGLTNAIARERGIEAYQAWLPLERIRPNNIPQEVWEERFAWPAGNRPPYPPLWRRLLRAVVTYAVVFTIIAVLLQQLTPFPVLTWLSNALSRLY